MTVNPPGIFRPENDLLRGFWFFRGPIGLKINNDIDTE